MSRSRPHNNNPNPATRWFEWAGNSGKVRYYDRDAKRMIDVDLPFVFLLLDELASVRGWHDASDSGIRSNMVRDVKADVLVVKAHKGGAIAEGHYRDIKDRVNAAGGNFTANLYVGFKGADGALVIGALLLKGVALRSWMEFRQEHRRKVYENAVAVTGYTEGKKGSITYRAPVFALRDMADATNQQAVALDAELQAWLDAYFARKTDERPPAQDADDEDDSYEPPAYAGGQQQVTSVGAITDDDIPF